MIHIYKFYKVLSYLTKSHRIVDVVKFLYEDVSLAFMERVSHVSALKQSVGLFIYLFIVTVS